MSRKQGRSLRRNNRAVINWLHGVVIGVMVAAMFALAVNAYVAQGAPSTPKAQLQTTLNPQSAQTLSILVTTQAYSTQPPNGIDLVPPKIVYSVYQNGKGILIQQTQALATTAGSLGQPYTMQTTLSVNVPGLCSTTGCIGQVDNITLAVTAQTSLFFTIYSAASNITFSNYQQYTTVQGNVSANPGTFYFNLYGSLVGEVFVAGLGIFLLSRHAAPGIVALVSLVILAGLYVAWVVL